jgi:VWFA-related protein
MRRYIMTLLALGFLSVIPGAAQNPAPLAYTIEIDQNKVFWAFREPPGKPRGLYVTVQFTVKRVSDGSVATDVAKEEIVVEEDRRRVADLEIHQPRAQNLTTVLALDISGSMSGPARKPNGRETGPTKMEEAKQAARTFLDRLDAKADSGLILFDHELRVKERPGHDPTQYPQHRQHVRQLIDMAKPGGGTAYLDAAAEAVRMLKQTDGRKAVLVMTDGVDMNSRTTLDQVIDEAKALGVPIYTLGVGEPGKNEPVTTVLVLDHSGSMKAKANDSDNKSKIEALKDAASRFVDLMRPTAKTTLLPFSTKVEMPQPFSTEKDDLKRSIMRLQPDGGTLLYDATYEGIETLVAARPAGKKAVVVLTDGKDESPGSRRSDETVIERAREAGVPLHMLGLGTPKEINQPVMRRMAEETGGSYHHAENQQKLYDIFEKLSIDLHDDGIDEASLRKLAEETGGKYYPAHDVSKLQLIYEQLAEELQSTYTVTFRSQRSSHDGTARGIAISVMRGGVRVSDVGSTDYNVRGVVVPEMDYRVYLVFLLGVVGLLIVPGGMRRLYKLYGGA